MTFLVAAAQMTSTLDQKENLHECIERIKNAKKNGAIMVALPENFAFLGENDEQSLEFAQEINGPIISQIKSVAKKEKIWISLGGFQEKIPGQVKIFNSHIIIDSLGEIVSVYRKIHLFSVTLPDKCEYRESIAVEPGNKIETFEGPGFIGGLSICYDLRFANLYTKLAKKKSQILFVPAAFTETTGKAHWEILLRARAIETQCYVVAAAQSGRHNQMRKSYGHSMIIDPWGKILAQCGQSSDLAIAKIDLNYLAQIRKNMPIRSHWRDDI